MLNLLARSFGRTRRSHLPPYSCRTFSVLTPSSRPQVKLIAELRKRTPVPLSKAREALEATSNDIEAALAWLEKDLAISGAKKAAKLEGRTAGSGLVGTVVLGDGSGTADRVFTGVRAAIVELNCETDFVARNELFNNLTLDIAHTAAFLTEPPASTSSSTSLIKDIPIDTLIDAPLISHSNTSTAVQVESTISTSIRDAMALLGEKISLRRVAAVSTNPYRGLRLGTYVHGAVTPSANAHAQAGSVASLVTLTVQTPPTQAIPNTPPTNFNELLASEEFISDFSKLARSTARQVVGMETSSIRSEGNELSVDSSAEREAPLALYEQPAVMFQGSELPVKDVLTQWAEARGVTQPTTVEVLQFVKWKAGEGIDLGTDGTSFADEVRKLQSGEQ